MHLEILQYAGSALGIIYFGMLSIRPHLMVPALKLAIVSCAMLSLYGFLTGQWAIFIAQTIYVGLNSYAIYKWSKTKITDGE